MWSKYDVRLIWKAMRVGRGGEACGVGARQTDGDAKRVDRASSRRRRVLCVQQTRWRPKLRDERTNRFHLTLWATNERWPWWRTARNADRWHKQPPLPRALSTHIYLHTHTYTPTYTHTYTHTHTCTLTPVHSHLPTHTPTHTNLHTPTNLHTHLPTHASTYTHTPTHTPIHSHLPTHTPTHTNLHTHTYTPLQIHVHTLTQGSPLGSFTASCGDVPCWRFVVISDFVRRIS